MSDLSIFGVDYDERPTRAQRRRQDRRRRRRNPLGPLLAVLLIVLLVGGIVYGGRKVLSRFGDVPDYAGTGNGAVTVQVKQGDTLTDIGTTLVAGGVVKSERAFRDVCRDEPRAQSIQPGVYRLHREMSAQSALALLLTDGSRLVWKFTVPEGVPVAGALTIIAAKTKLPLAQLQAAAKAGAALGLPAYAGGRAEGFLFPATYTFDPGTSAADILRKMVSTYRQRVDDSGLSQQADELGITPYQLLTVSSLVEKEAIAADFAKVARVVYNRLEIGKRLELDSTINYVLNRPRARLSVADTRVDSPYNTYQRTGLPPTPISNPGTAAIDAALHPAAGPWIYFVTADKSGRAHFTADYQEFLHAKARAQAAGLY